MKITEAVLCSIKDTLSWPIIKIALLTGVPLALIWIVIAFVFWNPMASLTSACIAWVPFSIVKANGAFLVGGFVWLQAVTITFALVIAIFSTPIFKFFSAQKFDYFAVLLLLAIALCWTIFAFIHWDFIYHEVAKVLTWFPFRTLRDGIALLLTALFFYNFFIASLALVVLAFRKPFLRKLQEQDYPGETLVESYKKRKFISIAMRDIAIFFVLMILSFPLFFVPFINMGLQVLFWAWLIKESYFLSASSLYATEEEIEELKQHKFAMRNIAFIASILNLIPLVNIFAPFFAQIIFFHWVMLNRPHLEKKLQTSTS